MASFKCRAETESEFNHCYPFLPVKELQFYRPRDAQICSKAIDGLCLVTCSSTGRSLPFEGYLRRSQAQAFASNGLPAGRGPNDDGP